MKYSVWDKAKGTYSVYESMDLPVPSFKKSSNLGATPQDSLETLPADSQLVGESEDAVGRIVKTTMNFWDFIIILSAGIAARWIYDKLIKD